MRYEARSASRSKRRCDVNAYGTHASAYEVARLRFKLREFWGYRVLRVHLSATYFQRSGPG